MDDTVNENTYWNVYYTQLNELARLLDGSCEFNNATALTKIFPDNQARGVYVNPKNLDQIKKCIETAEAAIEQISLITQTPITRPSVLPWVYDDPDVVCVELYVNNATKSESIPKTNSIYWLTTQTPIPPENKENKDFIRQHHDQKVQAATQKLKKYGIHAIIKTGVITETFVVEDKTHKQECIITHLVVDVSDLIKFMGVDGKCEKIQIRKRTGSQYRANFIRSVDDGLDVTSSPKTSIGNVIIPHPVTVRQPAPRKRRADGYAKHPELFIAAPGGIIEDGWNYLLRCYIPMADFRRGAIPRPKTDI